MAAVGREGLATKSKQHQDNPVRERAISAITYSVACNHECKLSNANCELSLIIVLLSGTCEPPSFPLASIVRVPTVHYRHAKR